MSTPSRPGSGSANDRTAGGLLRYTAARSMPAADGSRRQIDVLRNAARGGQERFLVGLADPAERQRIASALASEGFVQEVDVDRRRARAPGRRVVRRGRARPARAAARRAATRWPRRASCGLSPTSSSSPRAIPPRAATPSGARSRRCCRGRCPRSTRSCAPTSSGWLDSAARARAACWCMNAFAGIRAELRTADAELAAAMDLAGGRGQGRADDPRARRRRAGARRPARSRRRAATPDAVVVGLRARRRAGRAAGRGARARRRARPSSSSTTRPRPSACATRSTAARAPTCRARRMAARWGASPPRRRAPPPRGAGRAHRRDAGAVTASSAATSARARPRPTTTST